jgi:anti-anti-sigma factor
MTGKTPTIEKHNDVTCIILGPAFENLDEQILDAIRQTMLDEAEKADPPRVVVDLTHTKFFGSSFIEVLFRIWNHVNGSPGGKFALAGLTDYCVEVLTVTHLDKLWTVYQTCDEAVEALSAGS